MLRLLYRLTHPGEARRIDALDRAHRDQDGDRLPLASLSDAQAAGWTADLAWYAARPRSQW